MSISINSKLEGRDRRRIRVRKRIFGTRERPRVSVFRSIKHLSVQVVDDEQGATLVHVHSHGKSGVKVDGKKSEVAVALGAALAQACKEKGIASVVFDRGGFRYHGRVKAVADAARDGGLKF